MSKAALLAIVPFVSIFKIYDILKIEMCIAMTLILRWVMVKCNYANRRIITFSLW